MIRLFPLLLVAILVIIPVWRIIRRTGLSPAWALLLVVPILGFPIVALVVAYSRWPTSPLQGRPTPVSPPAGSSAHTIALLPAWFAWVLLSLWAAGRVVKRAGYSPWWVLLLLIPLVNIVMLWVFASARWPSFGQPPTQELVPGSVTPQ